MKQKNKFDYFIIIPLLLMIILGLMMIYSVTFEKNPEYFYRQLIWVFLSLLVFLSIQFVSIKIILASSYLLFFFNMILLIFLKLLSINNVERWIDVGFFYIQPSEFAKFTTILALGRFLSYRINEINTKRVLMGALLLTVIPFILVFIQPDLGTSTIFVFILIFMLILANAKISYVFILISPLISIILSFIPLVWIFYLFLFIIILYIIKINVFSIIKLFFLNIIIGGFAPIVWGMLRDYQKIRILSFIYPQKDIHGYGWHLLQSKIAIGSGGFLGKGFLHGTQKGLDFIPQQHTDFIFSAIGEEFGLMGFIFLILLILIIYLRIIYVYPQIKSKFSSLISASFISVIVFQMFLNIAMTIGIIPIVGLPLNFISYGGSNLLSSILMLGIINKIIVERFNYW